MPNGNVLLLQARILNDEFGIMKSRTFCFNKLSTLGLICLL